MKLFDNENKLLSKIASLGLNFVHFKENITS